MTNKQAVVLRALGTREAFGLQLTRGDCPIGRGSVYVMLGRLRAKGFVECREQAPDPGERGPARVLYRRTETGRRALELWDELVALEAT